MLRKECSTEPFENPIFLSVFFQHMMQLLGNHYHYYIVCISGRHVVAVAELRIYLSLDLIGPIS